MTESVANDQLQLRKDPITRSWVVIGHAERQPATAEACPLCAAGNASILLALPSQGVPQVRVVPHFDPVYRVEGGTERTAEGIYDRMRAVGAHEIVIESPDHGLHLANQSDEGIERVLTAYSMRIADLKRDQRFKYVTVFKNRGAPAGEDWEHPHSQITATTFVPRRVLYELRAAREHYLQKDRCVFCDIIRQEEKSGERIVDSQGDYLAFCPYASRVPFELWLVARKHNHLFEAPRPEANRRNLAALLGRTLRRLTQIAPSYHMVIHTAPNLIPYQGALSEYWQTIADDYHWHIEILPIVEKRSKSYSIKEIYFNSVLPEQAAERLRQLDPSA
ncbi:MAG: galactose-1-phosphate uridylyltransferase [Candidatus Acidiferrales bacterium]